MGPGAVAEGEGEADWFHPILSLFFFFFPLPLSPFIASLPFLSGLFGFDSGQMVKLCEPDREFY